MKNFKRYFAKVLTSPMYWDFWDMLYYPSLKYIRMQNGQYCKSSTRLTRKWDKKPTAM